MRDKQIEEMHNDVKYIHRRFLEDDDCDYLDEYIAVRLYEKGYRKASDVIEEVFLALDKRTEDEGLVFIKKSDIVNAIKKKKVEIARELFEEIEKYSEVALMNGHIETPILCIGFGVLAELKKKYESEGEG